MARVRNYLKRADGTPWPFPSVLIHTVDCIQEASKAGVALRLTAEQVRALDWAVIRVEGDQGYSQFRERAFHDAAPPDA
jgi:hypothetical protein